MGQCAETSRTPGQLLTPNPMFLLSIQPCSLSSPAQAPVNSVPYPSCSARAKRDTREVRHACFCLFAVTSKWEHWQNQRWQLHQEKNRSKSDELFTEPFRVEEALKVLESNHFFPQWCLKTNNFNIHFPVSLLEDPLLPWLVETKQIIRVYKMARIRRGNDSFISPL